MAGLTAYRYTYTYDSTGNRLSKVDDSGTTSYSYDAANRQRYSQTISGRTSFTYDADGNQTQIESPLGELTTSTWDYENQVREVENYQGDVVTYTYGIVTQTPAQKRVAKDDGSWEIRYRWDADNIAQETDDLGAVVADYTLQPEAQGDLISQYREMDACLSIASSSTRRWKQKS